ncbi:MAG TPA: xanthine dehydrogenase family protein molybdopterin-binding subunit [Candidatus Sulfotelmatobacter sp.]|nr:xanthine dehydrogenase family protein molybdopterin-binding subunit [Candidatus Sulfotelmatobacter sp.]
MSEFRYIGRRRRPKEDRRFVTGNGRFAADIALQGTKHIALVASPHPCARIVSIDAAAALAAPGVLAVLTGDELAAATNPLMIGVNTPQVRRYPMAVGRARYAGEWVAAVVADSRALAEDAAELVVVGYEPLPFNIDPERALDPATPPVHPDHGSNILLRKPFIWGPVDDDFRAAPHTIRYRARWGRSATVPIETFAVLARWDPGNAVLDVWASIQMPKYADQIARALKLPGNAVRVHHDVDVGGSYGVKRGIKHTILTGYLARKLGCPVRLIEDRLENMQGGDMHGPDRIFDVELAFDGDGIVRSMRMRALDNAGAYTGRAPLQLGKPVTAIVGPYRIHSVAYEAISVTTNRTPQEAVRGFGQGPTNFAIETGIDKIARFLGLDRHEIRRRNFIRHDEFPYRIPSGSAYDSGDYHEVQRKTIELARWPELVARRDRLRAEGWLAGIGIASCLEPSGGNSAFEPLLNDQNDTTTWMEGVRVRVDALGAVTVVISTTSAGQGHETLAATVAGEILQREPDDIRVTRADSLSGLPTNSPVGSRMAIMMGGAVAEAARRLKAKLMAIAAHDLGVAADRLVYDGGTISVTGASNQHLTWDRLVHIAHRNFHRLPDGMEPGLEASYVMQVPTGGDLPTADGRVQIYPCYSFEFHIALIAIDRGTGKPHLHDYFIGHDCGTVINPDIVRGMTLGGIAHGIGAALYELFQVDPQGQPISQSLMDYLLPSAHEIPHIEMVEHHTPSPHTAFGQKGSGEAGYLGAPACIASAVNDALAPLGRAIDALPMRIRDLEAALAAAPQKGAVP